MESILPDSIEGIIEAATITQVDRLHVVTLGEPGAGKSWLTCTGRKPILVYDFDDRKESIAGKPGVFIKQVVDRDPSTPRAWSMFDQDLGALEYAKQKGELGIKTIAMASLTFALKAAHNQLMRDNVGLCRKIKVNGREHPIPQGWDSVNVSQAMLEGAINRMFELGIDVIVEAHIRREKAADSTQENPKFTGKWSIDPQNLKMLLPKFNERWFMLDDFKVQTKPNYEFNAVTALNIGESEDANIEKILQKHAENSQRLAGSSITNR